MISRPALVIAGLEERFGAASVTAFARGYGRLLCEGKKAEVYRDLYEFF